MNNKLYFATLCMAFISLISCQTNEIFDTLDDEGGTKIGFSLLDTQISTRGTAREGDDLAVYNTNKVNVFVYSYDNTKSWSSINAGEYSFYFRSKLNDLNDDVANPAWSYAPGEPQTRFYPQSKSISCFAYASDLASVTGAAPNENGLSITDPKVGVPTITYTAPPDVEKQPDLIVSERVTDRNSGRVTLPMKHALTRIGILMRGKGQKIADVHLTGVVDEGSLSLDVNGAIQWNLKAEPSGEKYKFGFVKSYVILSEEVFNPLRSDGYLMMLPQQMTNQVKLNFLLNDQPASVSLDAASFPDWEAGRKITYLIDVTHDTPVVSIDFGGNVLSNCYIINPSPTSVRELKIPVTRVNQFWGDNIYDSSTNGAENRIGPNDPWTVSILWYDAIDLGSLPQGRGVQLGKATGIGGNDYFTVVVPAAFNLRGNLVVGIAKGDNGPVLVDGGTTDRQGNLLPEAKAKCLWSWHIWITDYDPYVENVTVVEAGPTVGKYAIVPDGFLWQAVEKSFEQKSDWVRGLIGPPYLSVSDNIWSNNMRMLMDRPIGVRSKDYMCEDKINYIGTSVEAQGYEPGAGQATTRLNGNGIVYYQFGRKDPFPADINLYTIRDGIRNSEVKYTENANGVSAPVPVWYGVYNPLRMVHTGVGVDVYKGGGNWSSDEYARSDKGAEDILWADPRTVSNSTAKSIFDPSPWLFRAPRSGAYNSFVTNYAYHIGTSAGEDNPNNNWTLDMKRNKMDDPSYMDYVLTSEVKVRFWSWGSRFWKTGKWNDGQGFNGQYWMSATVPNNNGWDFYLLISPPESDLETVPSTPSLLSGQTVPIRMNPQSPGIRASTMPLISIQNQLPRDPGVSLLPWNYSKDW